MMFAVYRHAISPGELLGVFPTWALANRFRDGDPWRIVRVEWDYVEALRRCDAADHAAEKNRAAQAAQVREAERATETERIVADALDRLRAEERARPRHPGAVEFAHHAPETPAAHTAAPARIVAEFEFDGKTFTVERVARERPRHPGAADPQFDEVWLP
jgi:hypothetical protein